MQVIGVQVDTVWEDKQATFARVRQLLEEHQPASGALIVLPEMFSTGFSFDIDKIAEAETRETETFLADTAAQFGVFMLGGVVNHGESPGKGRNECVVFDPAGKLICRYVKQFPFTFGGEAEHYESGNRIMTFAWRDATVAPVICYDLRFPELFRAAGPRGITLYTVIANWPRSREQHWMALLGARAIENQAYVIGVNRCGSDPNIEYGGRSRIIDPQGTVLVDAGNDQAVITAEIDLDALAEYRRKFPALDDMRDDLLPGR